MLHFAAKHPFLLRKSDGSTGANAARLAALAPRLVNARGRANMNKGLTKGLAVPPGSSSSDPSEPPVIAPGVTSESGLLASPTSQAAAFGFLSATSAAFALVAIAAPGLLLSLVLPGTASGPLDETFVRVAGATMVISATAEYCIKDAVENGRLRSATYQRLMLGCAAKSAGYLLAFSQASQLWNPLLTFYPALAAASVGINLLVWRRAKAAVVAGAPAASGDALLARPRTGAGWAYAAFAALYAATAAACYAPEALFIGQLTPTSALLKQTWAPGFLLAGVACLVLRGAADRGRLGAGTFKRLNLGLAILELIYATIFGAALLNGAAHADANGISNIAGSGVIAAFCAYNYATAKK